MSFNFYTLGGSQFWEDVFYYQKWRIQRNYKTKKYRLLDNWDIRRTEGSFENCRRAFLKYIEAFQLSRQKGHMVIMLHGLADSKNIFKPLWRDVIKTGLLAAAINYPSTRKRIDGHIRQFDFFMNHLEDIEEVSFVTKGVGSLILNKALSFDSPWQHKIKINRIVEINPVSENTTSFFVTLSKFRFFNWLLGPMLQELKPDVIQKISFPINEERIGVIQYNSFFSMLGEWLPESFKKYFSRMSDMKSKKTKNFISFRSWKICPLKDERVLQKCVKFLTKGEFLS